MSEDAESIFGEDRTPSEDGERSSSLGSRTLDDFQGQNGVERRILAKIADICSPQKTGASSRLLHQSQVSCWRIITFETHQSVA